MSAKWTRKPATNGWYIKSFTGKETDYATAIYIRDGKYNFIGEDLALTYDLSDSVDGENLFYGPIAFPKRKVKA